MNQTPRKPRVVTLFLIALMLWVGGFVLFSAASIWRLPQKNDQKTDVIVVLTGGGNRVEEGLILFALGKTKELFISGVHPGVTENEVRAMWKGRAPLPECCITLERTSISTLQNAQQTRDWLKNTDYHSIRLVTANYHMNRALLHFSLLLPGVDIIPHPVEHPNVGPRTKRFWLIMLSEYHKTLFRLVSGPYIYAQEWFESRQT
ncbi:MAG: YdcF family protein [Alphaproteobacteria bacterium]